jgi:hypothetical protein
VVAEEFGVFTGTGAVIVFFAALALGGCLAAALQVPGPGARATVADDDLSAGAAADSTAASDSLPSMAGSRSASGSFLARMSVVPGRTGYFPPHWDDAAG